jgi:hypothetical protein
MGLVGIDVEERRRRMLAYLQPDPEMARLAPLLNSIVPLELPDNELTAQLAGEVRADNTRELLVQLLQAAVTGPGDGASPLLLVLDDAHWFDSASWALTRQVVARVRPLLLVLATRPLAEPLPDDYRRLRQEPATECLRLEPLAPRDTLSLACDRLGVRRLPEPVAVLIEERAQGNPFFSEELAYAFRDAGLIRITNGTCTVTPGAGDLSGMSFPDTMQGVVASRIDRLAPRQELALKVASVIGRLFTFHLLRDIHPIEADRGALRVFLDDLQRQDFTVLDTPAPNLAYLFRHVVTQEVAYGLLLASQRRQLHRAVAEWYEQTQVEDLASLYPLLAYHWGRAEEPTKTLTYLELAGEQALRLGAYQEAVDLLTQALSGAGAVQPPPDAVRQARWHRQLGDAYEGLGCLPESRQHAEQAVALLGWPVPSTRPRLLAALAGQALRHGCHAIWPERLQSGARIDRDASLEGARAYERLAILNYYASARAPGVSAVLHQVNLAERAGPSAELARAYGTMSVGAGIVQLHSLATRYAQRVRQIAREADDLPALAWVLETTCAFDISVGNWPAAHEALTEGLRIAQHLGDQRRWHQLTTLQAQVLYHQGEFDRLAEWSAEMSALASHVDDPQRKAHILLQEAWYLMPQGRMDAVVPRLHKANELLAGRGSPADEILSDGILALAYLRGHDEERARLTAHRASSLIAQVQPAAVHILDGYASVAEVYLRLWEAGDPAAARPARQSCAALRQYARAFPIARPRAWLCQGLAAHLSRGLLRNPGPTDEAVPPRRLWVERSVGTSTVLVLSSRQTPRPTVETMEPINPTAPDQAVHPIGPPTPREFIMTALRELISETPCTAISFAARSQHCLDPPSNTTPSSCYVARHVDRGLAREATALCPRREGGRRGCPTREAGKPEGRATDPKANLLILLPFRPDSIRSIRSGRQGKAIDNQRMSKPVGNKRCGWRPAKPRD